MLSCLLLFWRGFTFEEVVTCTLFCYFGGVRILRFGLLGFAFGFLVVCRLFCLCLHGCAMSCLLV